MIHLSGCSSTGDSEYKSVHQTSSDATFPIPPGIEDNVEFWRKVYGEMDRSQVVIHDNEYMSVIYEVVDVPGSGESRRAFVKGKQQEYRDRLATLERKVTYGESLTSAEEEMKAELEAVGGRNAIFGAADRVRTQQGMRERFRSGMEISGRYDQAFREIFRKHGVPEDLAFLPHVESSFQSKARSGVGAAGLWQFMPATGRVYDLQVDHKLDERMDPLLACEGAARYLSAAHRKLGSWPLAITSYNHGQGGIAKAKSLHGSDIGKIVENYKGAAFGFDSRNFYSQFVAAREVAGNPKKYFPDGVAFHRAHDNDRLVLKQPMSAQQLAGQYGLSVYQLDDLNPSWSNAIVKGDASIPAGASVWLPAGATGRNSGQPVAAAPAMIARQEKEEPESAFEPESEFLSVRMVSRSEPVLAKTSVKPEPVKTAPRAQPTLAKVETSDQPDFDSVDYDRVEPKARTAN
ncbi:MAG TPA: lytic transglycosylase domain-containing protein, partial [Chromatiaceae bacterium]|nr:lytic transglycosylase domain-containing protein [Chromatiaceae bacterium]